MGRLCRLGDGLFLLGFVFVPLLLVLSSGGSGVLGADCADRHPVEINAISAGDQRLQIFDVADIDAQRVGQTAWSDRLTQLRKDIVVDSQLQWPAIRRIDRKASWKSFGQYADELKGCG